MWYKPNSGSDIFIDSVKASDGLYYWTVENNPSINNRIRIKPLGSGTNLSTSADFTICPFSASVDSVTPDGGENLYPGTYQAIKWQKNNVKFVDLYYSIDSGLTWNFIKDSISSSPFYWLIPNTPSQNCLIHAFASGFPGYFDFSDSVFTINAPFVGNVPLISTSAIVPNPCKNDTFNVFYTLSAFFDSSNTFLAQLSDSLGSFTGSITTIGFKTDSVSGSILSVIPNYPNAVGVSILDA